MLKMLIVVVALSFISTGIIALVGSLNAEFNVMNISDFFAMFIIQFVILVGIVGCFSVDYTLSGVMRCMWLALIFVFLYCLFREFDDAYGFSVLVLLVISIIFSVCSLLIAPNQKLICIYDVEELDIYTEISDEILMQMGEKDVNYFREHYKIYEPEMRKIEGKNVAVYMLGYGDRYSDYIPGYIIKDGDSFKFVNKKIYYELEKSKIRRAYPTFVIGECKFDIDDDLNPYGVFEYREKYYKSNGKDDYGIITIDLRDGSCKKYNINEIPDWVDFKTTEPK